MNRRLSREEAALWSRLARSVAPLGATGRRARGSGAAVPAVQPAMVPDPTPPRAATGIDPPAGTLDAQWDRKLAKGLVAPDFTIDLHGHSLAAAHSRLDHGLALASGQGARLVLLVTGKPRTSDGAGGRGERRGAIRAKVFDWLAQGNHAGRIAAIRAAHPRHGGAGALYLVLRRAR